MGDTSPLPFAALIVLGFLVSAAGHLYKSPVMIGTGLLLIFLGSALLQLGLSRG
jgi:hypothetical protein